MGKKALLMSCNYPGSDAELKGCWNDTQIWKQILTDMKGFREEDITILTDADASYEMPTGANMRKYMRKICEESEPGDYIFIQYSGHGTQVDSLDEEDGKDEALCPCDMNLIIDNDVREIANLCKSGVHLTFVADCCHSDHAEVIIDSDKKADPDAVPTHFRSRALPQKDVASFLSKLCGKEVGEHDVRSAVSNIYGDQASKFAISLVENYTGKKMGDSHKKMIGGFINSAFGKFGIGGGGGDDDSEEHHTSSGQSGSGSHSSVTKPSDHKSNAVRVGEDKGVLISGCRSHQTSADVRDGSTAYGALSKNCQIALEKNPSANAYELVHGARDLLADKGFQQDPCLECSQDNATKPFICPS